MSQPHAESKRRQRHRKAAEILAQRASGIALLHAAAPSPWLPEEASEQHAEQSNNAKIRGKIERLQLAISRRALARPYRQHWQRLRKLKPAPAPPDRDAAYRPTEDLGTSSIKSLPGRTAMMPTLSCGHALMQSRQKVQSMLPDFRGWKSWSSQPRCSALPLMQSNVLHEAQTSGCRIFTSKGEANDCTK